MKEVIENIFTMNLGVKNWDKVLVFTDLITEEEKISDDEKRRREALRRIAKEVAEAGKRFCNTIYLEFSSIGSHGAEPPVELWEVAFGPHIIWHMKDRKVFDKILTKKAGEGDLKVAGAIVREYSDDAPNAVIALSNYSTSHTKFRELLTVYAGTRYASMPLFEESMLLGAMSVDWTVLKERTEKVASLLNGGTNVYISTPNGTSINFSIKGRKADADTGILTGVGAFGNLPAGEAYLAPVEGTAQGTLVLDWAPTRKLKNLVTLKVQDGKVVKVSGDEEFADDLRGKIEKNPLFGNIAELGIGTNDKASRPDNILETEKILGTIHIALGDNSGFGGKVSVPFHQDFIFFKPTVEVEKGGEKITILKDGEPRF